MKSVINSVHLLL